MSPDDNQDTDDLELLVQALEERERLKLQSPITFYSPHGGQAPFHSSQARIRILEGGNRGGKTTAGTVESISASQGHYLWDSGRPFLSGNGKPIEVPNVGIVAAESYKTSIQETIWPSFQKWLPRELVKRTAKNQQGVIDRIEFKNGSTIRFLAYNQDPREFEGPYYYHCWYDEPPPRHVFEATQRGLVDHFGRSWFTMTPLREPWIFRDLVSEATPGGRIEHFRFDSFSNPHVPKQALIEYFNSIKDPAMREARMKGSPLHLQGLVFPEWQPRKPYLIPYFTPKRNWVRIMGIDPHPRKPIACLWIAINPDTDIWYCYREMYSNQYRTVEEVTKAIQEAETFEEISIRVIDPAAQENEKTSGFSVYDLFLQELNDLHLAQRHDKLGGIELIHHMLDTRNIYQTPQLVVMESCPTLKRNFLNYIWSDWAIQKSREEKDLKPEVRKKEDDMIDIVRYLRQFGQTAEDFRPVSRKPRSMLGFSHGTGGRSLTGY